MTDDYLSESEAFEALIDAVNEFTEKLNNFIKSASNQFFDSYIDLSRKMFAMRINQFWLPFWLSSWIAEKWPRRWLPYKWIWSG